MKVIKPILVLSCALLFACKNDVVKQNTQVKVKYKPEACCSSNLPSRFGIKATGNVRQFGDKKTL
ncbi:hypothetical protein EZ456_12795 [Pedobacter psychrodurus]|uniref:Uncharacterized protein n=1 Tax=Pedobacter psychrodurus TaxID=2530456 RepID=A0A4R0PV69_9SPHI|nr:hypothetical protein [Pedobacter psychrodurus]TCD26469.1 hypothetical protein EZ456_12795 [Pedobacter psychrodurus]